MKLKSLELFLLFRVFYSSLGWLVIRSFRTDYFFLYKTLQINTLRQVKYVLVKICKHNAIVILYH
ncbi:hypothetical protein GCM10010984_20340 [Chishuiella changwenlii]|uniref:Secreted protein n=1 Tax=Chishuiella changwenlii TaxID=1434701 RepID=A0ABQ1TSL6_9FLAO|nr:hypothetical protein GCM10010984_20340 [Chishuiella changwenlii]